MAEPPPAELSGSSSPAMVPLPWYRSVQEDVLHPIAAAVPVQEDRGAARNPLCCTSGGVSNAMRQDGSGNAKGRWSSEAFVSQALVAAEMSMIRSGAVSGDGGSIDSGDLRAYARAMQNPRTRVCQPVPFRGNLDLDLNFAPQSEIAGRSHVEPEDMYESTKMVLQTAESARKSNCCLVGAPDQSIADPQVREIVPVGHIFELNHEASYSGCASAIQTVPDSTNEANSQAVVPWKTRCSEIAGRSDLELEEICQSTDMILQSSETASKSKTVLGGMSDQSIADPQVGEIVPVGHRFDLNLEASYSGCASTSKVIGDGAIQTVPDSTNEANSQAVVPWKTRNCVGKGPDRREKIYGKPSALEQALMKFADRSSDYIISPDIGIEFDNCDEAYEYYNLYSWEIGFGIRYGKKRYSDNKENRKLPMEERYQLGQEYLCSCAGRPLQHVKTTSIRTNCPAKLRLARTSDHGWIVVEHVATHNHQLSTSYGEKKHWPSHSRLDKYTKDLVRMLRQNNIGITKLYSILGTFFGKIENVPTTKRCLKSLCQKINREQADNDIKKTLALFSQYMKDDPGFKYVVDPDENGRIKTLMWTNSRSIMQYEHFGDAITFDTTYKTNLYEMPFGLFVGVNNHFQSVLLAGVLMTDETIESFEWVFSKFASLMGGKEPKTILTDQCRAMEVAIGNIWKNTRHRWCKWHVLKRVSECVGQKYTANRDFREKFHKILNEMLTEEEFVEAWGALLDEYGLKDNAFLKQIFATRKMWVKSYFKGIFCARMTSTQRSESANMMLKNIVPASCPLNVFVEQYAKLQYIRDEEENYQERRSKMDKKQKITGGPLVRHATALYTPNVLLKFLELKDESEFYKTIEVSAGRQYIAEHYDLTRAERWCKGRYLVTIEDEGAKYTCECGLFEHFGLPCSHIIRVMVSRCVQEIPESMIMTRWTKKARLHLPAHMHAYNRRDPNLLSQTYRHSSLMISALEYVEMADRNPECYIIGLKFLADGKKAMSEVIKESDGLGLAARVEACPEDVSEGGFDEFPQRAPKRRRERGRPTNKRDKAGHEGLSKRPRLCSICRSDTHNKTTCPDREQHEEVHRRAPTCSRCGLEGHTLARCSGGQQQLVAIRDMLV